MTELRTTVSRSTKIYSTVLFAKEALQIKPLKLSWIWERLCVKLEKQLPWQETDDLYLETQIKLKSTKRNKTLKLRKTKIQNKLENMLRI